MAISEKQKKAYHKWYMTHIEEARALSRKYYNEHKIAQSKYSKKYYMKHRVELSKKSAEKYRLSGGRKNYHPEFEGTLADAFGNIVHKGDTVLVYEMINRNNGNIMIGKILNFTRKGIYICAEVQLSDRIRCFSSQSMVKLI